MSNNLIQKATLLNCIWDNLTLTFGSSSANKELSKSHGPKWRTISLSLLASNLIRKRFLPNPSTLKSSFVLHAFAKIFFMTPGTIVHADRSFPKRQCSIWLLIKLSNFGSNSIQTLSSSSNNRSFLHSSLNLSSSIPNFLLASKIHLTKNLSLETRLATSFPPLQKKNLPLLNTSNSKRNTKVEQTSQRSKILE